MSYILDALRKSDRQRQIGAVPRVHTLQDHYAAEPVARNPWIAVAVIAILINIGIGGWFWWQHQQPTAGGEPLSAAAADPAQQQMGVHQAVPAPTVQPADASQIARAVPTPPAPPVSPALPRPTQPLPAGTPAVDLEQVVVFESIAQPRALAAPAAHRFDDLVDISELPSSLHLAMLALKINVHVYDPKASQRFVLIDMKRYAEGHALPQGPVIEAITPDGVVLAYQGRRFLLTRN